MGVTGQQQQASIVSAEDVTLGGAGGLRGSTGGGTKPTSVVPSPANKVVPIHNVDIKNFFILLSLYLFFNCYIA